MQDLMIGEYRVVCVSATAPETYNVIDSDDIYVGNIKLRRGVLEVRYPNFEGEVIYSTQPYGAIKANEFDKPYERNKFIQIAVDAIDRHLKQFLPLGDGVYKDIVDSKKARAHVGDRDDIDG